MVGVEKGALLPLPSASLVVRGRCVFVLRLGGSYCRALGVLLAKYDHLSALS